MIFIFIKVISIKHLTKLSHYNIDNAGIDVLIANMSRMGLTQLSETGDLTLDIVHEILAAIN